MCFSKNPADTLLFGSQASAISLRTRSCRMTPGVLQVSKCSSLPLPITSHMKPRNLSILPHHSCSRAWLTSRRSRAKG